MSLQDILRAVPSPKTLTIQELKDLDDAELKAVIEPYFGPPTPVRLRDEAA